MNKRVVGVNRTSSEDRPELRVLQVFTALGVGGAETWLIALLKYFREHEEELPFRVRFDICLTGGFKAAFDDEAVALGARLFYIPYTRRKLPTFVRRFRTLLRRGRYHAIHDHQDYTAGLHFLFGLGLLPPVHIAHVHNPLTYIAYYSDSPARRATVALGKYLVARLSTHIMGTSRQVVTEYGFDEPAFAHIERGAAHCGFDVARYGGSHHEDRADVCREFCWDDSVKIMLFVGRLESIQKNPRFALGVVRECIARDPSIRLLMVGEGGQIITALAANIREWGLERKIRLLGICSDVPRLMCGADLLLFPSVAEGLGMVAVEAQAAGLPVLASDTVPHECAVLPEIVKFLPLQDGASAWVEQALRMMQSERPNPEICNRAVRESEFSIENSAQKLMRLYDAIK